MVLLEKNIKFEYELLPFDEEIELAEKNGI